MIDSSSSDKNPSNVPEYSVSEIGDAVKRTIEGAYGYVRIRGEVSQPKLHGSGHLYLRLKDDQAVIESVCWRGSVSKLSVMPEEGMEVICTGRITTYKGRSQYQLVIENIELAGLGALMKMLEALKQKLTAEGLFEPARKKPIPFLPKTIGVITSPTGAVIQDILHRISDRFPRHVLMWPVAVQGEGAAEQVIQAVKGFQAFDGVNTPPKPDVLIVARGGGSFEDLMAFNDENLIRTLSACDIPIISAIGHETDTTLCDYVADLRAPTPTGAAEKSVPVRLELHRYLQEIKSRIGHLSQNYVMHLKTRVESLGRGLIHPRSLLENHAQRLDDRASRLKNGLLNFVHVKRNVFIRIAAQLKHPKDQIRFARERLEVQRVSLHRSYRIYLERLGQRLTSQKQLLMSYSFERTLERGFVLVTDQAGHLVTEAAKMKAAESYTLGFKDGKCDVVLGEGQRKMKASAPKKKVAAKPIDQGSLF